MKTYPYNESVTLYWNKEEKGYAIENQTEYGSDPDFTYHIFEAITFGVSSENMLSIDDIFEEKYEKHVYLIEYESSCNVKISLSSTTNKLDNSIAYRGVYKDIGCIVPHNTNRVKDLKRVFLLSDYSDEDYKCYFPADLTEAEFNFIVKEM